MGKIIKCLPLLSWLFIPAIVLWVSTSYLIGYLWHPSKPTVLGQASKAVVEEATANNLEKLAWKGEGLVTLWFDDAWESQYSLAYPSLEKRGVKAALAVPTNLIGYEAYMGWSQIQKLQYKGWEITSHTRSHKCEFDRFDEQTLDYEIVGARYDLEKAGLRAQIFVSPCGVESPQIDEVVKKFHLGQRSSESGFNPLPVTNPYYLKAQKIRFTTTSQEVKAWLNEARKSRSWLIIVFHQISYEGEEYSVTPETLQEILDLIETSGLSIVLPSQVLSIKP